MRFHAAAALPTPWLFRCVVVVLVLLMASASEADERNRFPWFQRPAAPPLPSALIAAEELADLAAESGTIVVDLRVREAFQAGHLAGALWLGPGPWPADLPELCAFLGAAGLPSEAPVVLVDGAGDPERLAQPFYDLARIGQQSVRVLTGGMASWPGNVETGVERPQEIRRTCLPAKASMRAEELAPQVGQAGLEILDLRAGWTEDYAAPEAFASGHVPHALPFEVGAPLPELSPAGLEPFRRRLLALGPREGDRVRPGARFVLYDQGPEDGRDLLGFLLLRAAGFDAAVLERGWRGWAGSAAPTVRIVDARQLAGWLGDTGREAPLIFDLREDWDHRAGHLPGAVSLPRHRVADDLVPQVEDLRPGLELASVPLVFYCYGRDCVRSRDAASEAARQGARQLYWFREGVIGWRSEGLELERDEPPPPSGP